MKWYRYWADARFHVEHASAAPAESDPVPPTLHVEQPEPGALDRAAPADLTAPVTDAVVPPQPDMEDVRFASATVVVANQKGGVGKTTTAVSVAAALAQRSLRVLLVDLDPQGNAGSGLAAGAADEQPTAYDVLVRDLPAEKAIVATSLHGLDLLPASLDLAGAEIELVSAFSREQKLERALGPVRERYDIVFVDCPPSLGLLTVNALTAGDVVLVPIQCEYYALEGLGSLTQNIELIRLHLNPSLETLGYVMTMHDGRTRLSEQVVAEVQAHFGDRVFEAKVPRSVRLAEAPSYGLPITVFDPGSRGAVAYHRVATELLERLHAHFDPSPSAQPGALQAR